MTTRSPIVVVAALGLLAATAPCAAPLSGQAADSVRTSTARRITVTWTAVPIREVLLAFATFSGKSIVASPDVGGQVTATIVDRPWDVALAAILSTQGLVAEENEYGIITVDDVSALSSREDVEPILTRPYRISYVTAAEIQAALQPLLTARGSISISESTNTVIVSDIARVHRTIGGLIRAPR